MKTLVETRNVLAAATRHLVIIDRAQTAEALRHVAILLELAVPLLSGTNRMAARVAIRALYRLAKRLSVRA